MHSWSSRPSYYVFCFNGNICVTASESFQLNRCINFVAFSKINNSSVRAPPVSTKNTHTDFKFQIMNQFLNIATNIAPTSSKDQQHVICSTPNDEEEDWKGVLIGKEEDNYWKCNQLFSTNKGKEQRSLVNQYCVWLSSKERIHSLLLRSLVLILRRCMGLVVDLKEDLPVFSMVRMFHAL